MKRMVFILMIAAVVAGTYQIFGQGGPPQRGGGRGVAGLEAQHQRLLPLFELAGVVFTDADENTGRFTVGVIDMDIEPSVRALVVANGVPFRSVDVIETEPIRQVATLRDQVRPVEGGLQIRFTNYLCSLSFNAIRNGVAGYVTAAHCSSTQGATDGTLYYQPLNQTEGEYIGQEVADPLFFKGGSCTRGRKCRYSDANFSAAASGVAFDFGKIAKTTGANNGSLEMAGQFTITGEGTASKGDTVNKVGRTTGWSQGQVTRTCANTGVQGGNTVLLCQNFVAAAVDSGDSGSPVFKITSGDNVALLGTLWGSSVTPNGTTEFVYSPISNIEAELGGLTTN